LKYSVAARQRASHCVWT